MRLTFSLPLVRLFSFTFVLLLASASLAQILSVGDDTSTPIPGVGHDYIRLLSETVNPANGSVSLRIQVPMPKARGITLPFSFAYDSNGVNHLIAVTGRASWISNGAFLSAGGVVLRRAARERQAMESIKREVTTPIRPSQLHLRQCASRQVQEALARVPVGQRQVLAS